MPASAILPCACLGSRPGRHTRWSSCCFAAAIRLLPEHLTEEIRRQTRARAGMALAKQTPAAELAAIDARLSQLQTCLKEVQIW